MGFVVGVMGFVVGVMRFVVGRGVMGFVVGAGVGAVAGSNSDRYAHRGVSLAHR